jgi:hypothetical protein
VRSSASGWLPARKYRYLYTRSTKRSYSSPNALASRETTTRLTSATTVGSSGPSMGWDGSVPVTDNVQVSCPVMGRAVRSGPGGWGPRPADWARPAPAVPRLSPRTLLVCNGSVKTERRFATSAFPRTRRSD